MRKLNCLKTERATALETILIRASIQMGLDPNDIPHMEYIDALLSEDEHKHLAVSLLLWTAVRKYIDAPPGTSCPVIEAVKGSDFVRIDNEIMGSNLYS